MPTHPEDLALALRIVGGDEDAAEEFGRQYVERFAHLARRDGVPPQDCQDVAQEALLTALGQMQRGLFRGESALGTWLEKIISGKIAEYWRKHTRRGLLVTIPEDAQADEAEAFGTVYEAALARPAEGQVVVMVRETLRLMPARYRAVLLLKRTEGYTIEELSRAMEMTMGQVARRLYTAEEMFRRIHCDGFVGRKLLAAADSEKEGGQ